MAGNANSGRDTKLTPETQRVIVEAVAEGNYLRHAAGLAGIAEKTVYNWIERGQNPGPEDDDYVIFVQALHQAESRAASSALRNVRDAIGGKDGAPHLHETWFLERRFPKLYGKQTVEVQHSGAVGVVSLDAAALEALKSADPAALRALLGLEEE